MDSQDIIDAVLAHLNCPLVRAKKTDGGWLIEVVHKDCKALGSSAFRRKIEKIVDQIPNQTGPAIIWKLFVYSNEIDRYLAQGTLHTVPSAHVGSTKSVTLSALDVYLDIPEYDAELLSFSDYSGHLIPSLVSIDGNDNPVLPYRPVRYHWLETMGGEYTVHSSASPGVLGNRTRVEVQL